MLVTITILIFGFFKTFKMFRLSERERISLLMMRGWGDQQRSYTNVVNLFNATFRNGDGVTPLSKSTVSKTLRRFEETGSIKNRPVTGRPQAATNEEKSLDVLLSFVENPHESSRSVALQQDIDQKSVLKILKVNKFHPYKMKLVQELNEDDPDRRIEFCETMMEMITQNPIFLQNIVFSDEATFQLNGEVNRHNFRYWSDTNPHWIKESHTQYPQKLNVWAGMVGDTIIGPFFIEGNLNAVSYEQLLRNQIVPAIQALKGDDFENIWFQQDGAPAHYGVNVRQYLNETFFERWIGRRGTVEWAPRSPDLTPLDYFLWGYLKDRVYRNNPQNLEELSRRIVQEINAIPRQMIRNAIESFYNRIGYCQEANGEQFEHLL